MGYRKANVPLSSLPGRDPNHGSHRVRYRLITSDRNKVSEWSPIFTITPPTATEMLGDFMVDHVIRSSTEGGRTSYTITWTVPEIFQEFPHYDIFVSWSSSDYEYYGTTTSETATIIVDAASTDTTLDVKIQIPTYPKQISSYALLFDASQITL